MGDCQGGLFARDRKEASGFEMDYAEATGGQQVGRTHTLPHCFGSIPRPTSAEKRRQEHKDESVRDRKVEKYSVLDNEPVEGFEDEACEREWQTVQREHPHHHVRLDRTLLFIGNAKLLVDARVSQSIQPTRALGDRNVKLAVRHPTVMRVDGKGLIVLCSDGAFSRGAFADLSQVSACTREPLSFCRRHFYRKGQEMTERLLACGLLASATQGPLHASLQRESHTWGGFVRFLRERHLGAMESEAMLSTFTREVPTDLASLLMHSLNLRPKENEAHKEWLRACRLSIEWLEGHRLQGPLVSLHAAAQTIAHLAVVMGSCDNVTVLVARA
jgi:hypothetical protein